MAIHDIWCLVVVHSSSYVVCAASLRCAYRLSSDLVRDPGILNTLGGLALGSAESILAVSRILQFMTLLPGVAFVLVMAFLATAVALNAGLVGCPFRFRLGSFVVLLVVGTRLTFSCIDLHSLQPIVVVFPGGDLPLSLSIGSSLVDTFLFHLSFVDSLVDL